MRPHMDPPMRHLAPVLATLMSLALAGCGGSTGETKTRFKTVKLQRGLIENVVTASGPIQPLKVVEIKSRASGQILERLVHGGGQLEAALERPVEAQLRECRRALAGSDRGVGLAVLEDGRGDRHQGVAGHRVGVHRLVR